MDTVSKKKNSKPDIQYISWDNIKEFIDIIYYGMNIEVIKMVRNIYPIIRGGIIPSALLSHKMNLPIILQKSKISKHTLVVDDIIDSGKTIKEYKSKYSNSYIVSLISLKTELCDFYGFEGQKNVWYVFPWER